MGAWDAGPWDNDAAWDFVDALAAAPAGQRAAMVVAALDAVDAAGSATPGPDVDTASAAVAAASLVAMARDPRHSPDERQRVTDHTGRVGGVESFAYLVGDLRMLRTRATARTALAAIRGVEEQSELAVVWADDARFGAVLDALRQALRARTKSWPRSSRAGHSAPRARPIRRVFRNGTIIMIDLGDGTRGYAVLRDHSYITCLSMAQPTRKRPLSPVEVAALPVAFTTTVNDYCHAATGWTAAGSLPEPEVLGPLPAQYWQDLVRPQECGLFEPGALDMIPAGQQECVDLDRYGAALFPASLEDRLRCHLAGVPHPDTGNLRVRLSRSVFRVVPREQAAAAAAEWRFPAGTDRDLYHAYYDLDLVPHVLGVDGQKARDLALVELDEAVIGRFDIDHRPLDPDDPASPTVLWARRVSAFAILAVHDLTLDAHGRLAPLDPVQPLHPR